MITIKDIAKEAGVSIATVSAVVNQTKYVSGELEGRVKHAIRKLGYRPNRIARSLKSKRSMLLGVTVTEVTNPFYPLLLKGIEEIALKNGYNLLLLTTGDDEQKEYKLVESMIEHSIDGLILSTIDSQNSKVLNLLNEENIKYVLINRAPTNFQGSMVCPDSYKVGLIATNYLIKLGHRDIAFMGGRRQNGVLRENGFRKAMEDHKISINKDWVLDGGYSTEEAFFVTEKLIKTGKTPTAIFTANDLMAFGVARAFLKNGFGIPEDVSVIGSDNIPFTEDFRIPLTTVDVNKFKMGRLGCEFIFKQLLGEEVIHEQELLEPELIVRESTGYLKLG
ncbi:LacI family DNA-binding transcriptional regulator [Bacillus sp. FJAT-49731]|nr:LacI family DNA-binding transcriptional regulator [Lederbergia citrea]